MIISTAATKKYIEEQLKRPELLNRLGDNIVAFDILRRSSFPTSVTAFLTSSWPTRARNMTLNWISRTVR